MQMDGHAQVNMSVAVIPMAEELHWSSLDRGLVSSAFFWGCCPSITRFRSGYWVGMKELGERTGK